MIWRHFFSLIVVHPPSTPILRNFISDRCTESYCFVCRWKFPSVVPYFFEEDGVTVTVTSDRYCEMFEHLLSP